MPERNRIRNVPSQDPEHRVVELRTERRASLLIRSAKLICQSGEYPCVVRDVSSGGTRLRLFHALPPEAYVLLELANGETYGMHRIWDRGLEAGYSFLHPISVDGFIEEQHEFPRRPLRLRIRRSATLTVGGQPVEAVLRNVSQGGACIEAAHELALRQPLRLAVAGMPDCHARVCWRRGLSHGLAFERIMGMDDLARIALDLQPFLPESALQQMPLMFDDAPDKPRRASA